MPTNEVTFHHHRNRNLAEIWDEEGKPSRRHYEFPADDPLEGWNGVNMLWPIDARTHDDVLDAFIYTLRRSEFFVSE
ncbi:hypothetical protein FOZ60_002382 [Perkinsus olseni]|uniref:Uncharacterized protein n=2 Tax=Perkinsus olseni TaxID=32597 RepID=A0A7J6NY17_PEROL|nr:hypothetical protein FOZ60_002382 [Perkinsus olseni]